MSPRTTWKPGASGQPITPAYLAGRDPHTGRPRVTDPLAPLFDPGKCWILVRDAATLERLEGGTSPISSPSSCARSSWSARPSHGLRNDVAISS